MDGALKNGKNNVDVTILIPALNEENSIAFCIEKAFLSLKNLGISGEVLVSDNGSTDNTVAISKKLGARVIHTKEKGYGSALRNGILNAKGKFIIMGDADDSYDFSDISPFILELNKGKELVMGNRFKGGIEKGAMPLSHKYIGNPILSLIGKTLYSSKINDWHCGMRGFKKDSIQKLNLTSNGMEFASEMIIKSEKYKLKTCEVPIKLYKDKRNRKPHLRSIPDGIRHLKLLFKYKFAKDI